MGGFVVLVPQLAGAKDGRQLAKRVNKYIEVELVSLTGLVAEAEADAGQGLGLLEEVEDSVELDEAGSDRVVDSKEAHVGHQTIELQSVNSLILTKIFIADMDGSSHKEST